MRQGMRLGNEPAIHDTAHVRDCRLGRFIEIGARTSVAETTMGDYSYVVNDAEIIYATIGKFCSIAAHTRINPGNHPFWRASQAHFTYRASEYFDGAEDEPSFFDWRRSHPVTVGHDAWLGHGAIILPGISVGTGAIVAAGAVVSHDVAPYTIVGGVPARLIRRRFAEDVSEGLLSMAWWDWQHDRLHAALNDFRALQAEEFVEKYGNNSDRAPSVSP